MSATSADPPRGRSIPLTKQLLLDFLDGYIPGGIIYEGWIIYDKRYGIPQVIIPGPHNTIENYADDLTIPFEVGVYPVGDGHNKLIFTGDDENGEIYYNHKTPQNQLFFYEPPQSESTNVSRSDRKKQRKSEGLWEAYLQRRDEIRNTQNSFDAYVMLRDILTSAKTAIATGEPMRYTINGFVDPLDSIELRDKERKTSLALDTPLDTPLNRPLDELVGERREKNVSGELEHKRGGRKTKKAKTNKKTNKSRKSRKQNKRKSRKQNKRKSNKK